MVIFEDYDKGVLSPEAIAEITDFANQCQVPTVVDPKKRNFLAYQSTTLFKPNLKELREGLKVDFEVSDADALRAVVANSPTRSARRAPWSRSRNTACTSTTRAKPTPARARPADRRRVGRGRHGHQHRGLLRGPRSAAAHHRRAVQPGRRAGVRASGVVPIDWALLQAEAVREGLLG